MAEVLDRTYHIIVEVDVDNPMPPTPSLIEHCIGRKLEPEFYLHSPEDSQRKWLAITIHEPYDWEDAGRYVPVVPAELEYVEEAISRALARIALSGNSILGYPDTKYIKEVCGRSLYTTVIMVEDGNYQNKEYDRYYVRLYFTM